MKAILIILFSCATAINYAQGYQSIFGDSLTKWNIATGYCDEAQTDSFFVIGDTMINLNEYKIIAKNSFVDTIGFIHEDTINGKAWFLNKKKQKEYLFYDLSLHEGDTFNLIDYDDDTIITTVNSVFQEENKKIIQLNSHISFCGFVDTLKIIEGVGTNSGIIYQGILNGISNYYLLCHYKNASFYYGNDAFNNECFQNFVGFTKESILESFAFPNPFNSHVQINFYNPDHQTHQLYLYNSMGQKILTKKGTDNYFFVESENLPNGVYLYQILGISCFFNGKIIKK